MQKLLTTLAHRLGQGIANRLPFLASMRHGSVQSYLLTLALMGLALWVRLAIAPVNAGLQYVTFFPAVTLAAIAGGYRTGLLATAIGLVLATYIFTPPYYSISIAVLQASMWSNMVFLMDGIIMSFAIEAMHRYRQRYALELQQSKDAHTALQGSTQYLKTILDNLFAYVALLDTNGVIQEVNQAPIERGGYRREDVIGQYFHDAPWWSYDENVRAQLIQAIDAARQGQTRRYDVVVKMGNDLVPLDFQISPVRDGSGRIVGLLPTGVDISERKHAEAALQESEAWFRSVFENTNTGIASTDSSGRITSFNEGFRAMLGYDTNTLSRMCFSELTHPDDLALETAFFEEILEKRREHYRIEKRYIASDGHIIWIDISVNVIRNANGDVKNFVGVATDITERKQIEEQVRQLAFYDPLTHLPNRRLLMDRLSQIMAISKRSGCYGAAMFLDLDHFKPLNDLHGHAVGDLLLIEVAERLRSCVREMDTVARFGGDEFVVIIGELKKANHPESAVEAGVIAEKIRSTLEEPYLLTIKREGATDITIEHHCAASIGVALFVGHGASQDDILKWADAAMYQAKETGRNSIRLYDSADQVTLGESVTCDRGEDHAAR